MTIPDKKRKIRSQGLCGNTSPCKTTLCVLPIGHLPITHLGSHEDGVWWCSGLKDSAIRIYEKVGSA